MHRTEFIAVGCSDLQTCVRSLEARGWALSTVREELAGNFLGNVQRQALRHPESPFPLVLVHGEPGLRVTVTALGDGKGYEWFQVATEKEVQIERIESMPFLFDTVELVAAGELPGFDGLGLS